MSLAVTFVCFSVPMATGAAVGHPLPREQTLSAPSLVPHHVPDASWLAVVDTSQCSVLAPALRSAPCGVVCSPVSHGIRVRLHVFSSFFVCFASQKLFSSYFCLKFSLWKALHRPLLLPH